MLKRGLLALLVSFFAFGSAADSETQEKETVYALIRTENDGKSHIDTFMETVNSNLNNFDIELVTQETKGNTAINFELTALDTDEIDETSIILRAETPVSIIVSPILKSQFDESAEWIMNWYEPEEVKASVELVTGISLYSINRCDLAISYLSTLDINVIATGRNISFVGFYQGNCAIYEGKFEAAANYLDDSLSFSDGAIDYPAQAINFAWTLLQRSENETWENVYVSEVNFVLDRTIIPQRWSADQKLDVLRRRAQLYVLAERYDDAIADLTTAIEPPSVDTPDLYLLRGQMYLALYEWDSALSDYNKAIELDPTYADAYYERGVLYYSILQTGVELRADALADFRHYLELAPDGNHAEDAARYVEQIELELAALDE